MRATAGFLKYGDCDMTKGVIWKELLRFSAPTLCGLIFQQLYNTVDMIVVGQTVGKEAMAAVGCTSQIIVMLVGLCAGFSNGVSTVVSQHYGAHENGKLSSAVHTAVAVTLIICVLATAAGLLLTDPMLRMMKTPDSVFGQAHIYLTIYFAGISGLLIYNIGSAILLAVGDSRRPLYFLMICSALNIVFDLVFVLALRLGVAGVAYATIISQFISAFLVMRSLSGGNTAYSVHRRLLKIEKEPLGRILLIGLPSGIQQSITAFSNVFVQSYINAFGPGCMGGWAAYSKLDAFLFMPVQSISMAAATFAAQNFGAGQIKRAKKGVRVTILSSLALTAVLAALLMIFIGPLVRIFNDDPEVIAFGTRFALIISPFYVFTCFYSIFSGVLRGAGVVKAPTAACLISFVAFRQLYLFVNARLGGGFLPMALGYPVGWILCTLLMALIYSRSVFCRGDKKKGSENGAARQPENM